MDAAEISSRLRQEFDKRADLLRARAGLTFHEVPTLPGATAHFFFESSDISVVLSQLRARLPGQADAIVKEAERICEHRFHLLGYSDVDYGRTIDWHLDAVHRVRSPNKPWFSINYLDPRQVGDAKVTWELSRHQHLITLAKAYRLTNDPRFALECFAQWYSWQRENEYPIGIHWSSSLELAIRSLSWLWVSFLLQGRDMVPPAFPADLLRALSVHARYIERFLSTYSSPNTHLLGEGVGLFFVGTLCPQLSSARRWQLKGWQIVLDEARKQVRPDGFHFEQSTYYHVYALDFFLHARMLAARNHIEIPEWFDGTILGMIEALSLLGQSGLPPNLGDDDGGRVFDSRRNLREHLLDPLSTGAVLFNRGDFKATCETVREETLWLMGPHAIQRFDELPSTDRSGSGALTQSGMHVMIGGAPPAQLVIDAGPQGTQNSGHGHADALSVHLSVNRQELLCDPGTFEYCGDGVGRTWFRSTRAHNTLAVDGLDQAEPRGPFAWNTLPSTTVERWIAASQFDVFSGRHNGYARLQPPVIHERWVVHFKGMGWLIRDVAAGNGSHTLDLAWHVAPNLSQRDRNFFGDGTGAGLRIVACDIPGWSEDLREEWWSPAYGVGISAQTMHHRFTGTLPADFAVFLEIAAGESPRHTNFLHCESGSEIGVRAFRYVSDQRQSVAVFATSQRSWSLPEWSSDADLLCYHFNRDSLESLLLCNASFVDWRGQRLWSRSQPVSWCELASREGKMEIVPHNLNAVAAAQSSRSDSLND